MKKTLATLALATMALVGCDKNSDQWYMTQNKVGANIEVRVVAIPPSRYEINPVAAERYTMSSGDTAVLIYNHNIGKMFTYTNSSNEKNTLVDVISITEDKGLFKKTISTKRGALGSEDAFKEADETYKDMVKFWTEEHKKKVDKELREVMYK